MLQAASSVHGAEFCMISRVNTCRATITTSITSRTTQIAASVLSTTPRTALGPLMSRPSGLDGLGLLTRSSFLSSDRERRLPSSEVNGNRRWVRRDGHLAADVRELLGSVVRNSSCSGFSAAA